MIALPAELVLASLIQALDDEDQDVCLVAEATALNEACQFADEAAIGRISVPKGDGVEAMDFVGAAYDLKHHRA